ncbi:MAG: glycosyltransferase family 4 protein [Gammaproteobacteria bacterium]|nr:glycosyltransferase family 4 protein [Gammaproteobacteria bacterium]
MAEKSGMIAQPGERQSHEHATPTGGGLGLIFSIVITTVCLQLFIPLPDFWWQNILPGVVLLAVVGWRDDRFPVSSLIRLLVQLAVSLWLLGFGLSEFSLKNVGLLAITTVAMVWMMNLYNFMDGSNGMAGFQGVFAGMTMAVFFQNGEHHTMALMALAVAAACAGFLPLNFPQARVFMGDVASVPLGFIFASLSVFGVMTGSLNLPVAVLIMSVFIVDATLTLLSRVFGGERWYTAHAQHVYQRLIAQGWSHRQVLLIYQSVNVIVVLPALVLVEIYPQYAEVTVGLTLILLGTCWHIAKWRLGIIAKVQMK